MDQRRRLKGLTRWRARQSGVGEPPELAIDDGEQLAGSLRLTSADRLEAGPARSTSSGNRHKTHATCRCSDGGSIDSADKTNPKTNPGTHLLGEVRQ
jgi:hypothetical protein